MQINVSPSVYNGIVDTRTDARINEARQRHYSRVQAINKSRTTMPSGKGGIWGLTIGVFVGFIACTSVCVGGYSAIAGLQLWAVGDVNLGMVILGAVGGGCITWVIVAIISVVIGYNIDKSAEKSYEKKQAIVDSRVREEEDCINSEIREIRDEAQLEKDQYFAEFESNAQNLSIQFAESELAKEVIDWMTNGFYKTIDAADRQSYVEKVTVPFVFNVFKNKITCNLGTFDFEQKRCKNLNSALEQTALARAIASAIQLNVIMKYPKDISGTDIFIGISYLYTDEYSKTTITYVAPNGNYETVHGW